MIAHMMGLPMTSTQRTHDGDHTVYSKPGVAITEIRAHGYTAWAFVVDWDGQKVNLGTGLHPSREAAKSALRRGLALWGSQVARGER